MEGVAEYVASLRRRGLADGTIAKRRGAVRAFSNWLHERGADLASAETHHVEMFLDERGVLGRTRYCWISHLHCFYVWAVDNDLTDRDPTARIERPKLRRLMPRPISEGDLEMAMSLANRTMRAWLALAAYAGLRCAEIAGLDVDCILHQYGVLRVLGKGGKERLVPMHPVVLDALDAYGLPKTGPVFRRPRGSRYPAAMVSKEGNDFLASVGVNATMHQLRHRFATAVYQASRDLRVTQELLGHASPTTTASYAAFSVQAARDAVLGIGSGEGQSPLPFSYR